MDRAIVIREAFRLIFEEDEENEENCSTANIVKNENYAEETVPRFSDRTFKTHFRVNVDVFEYLYREIQEIENDIPAPSVPGREPIKIEKKLMICLWYLGNPECMRSIADRFGVSIATVFRIVTTVCEMLMKLNRKKQIIKWPNEEEAVKTSSYYARKNRFPGIIGSIDGSHIPIRAPIIAHNSYINRKGFHSILLQGVCNHKMEFLYCYTGEAGSIHDALLLRRSGLTNKIESGNFLVNENQHLLGDSAYPLKNWLVTPFKDNGRLTAQEKIFNVVHSKCRVTIERAFGLLKGRFRRLFEINSLKPSSIIKYIMASCILHNICIMSDDNEEDFIVEDDHDVQGDTDNEINDQDLQTAQTKRNALMNALF